VSYLSRTAHDALCRDLVTNAIDRLDQLRSTVERAEPGTREYMERALDALRGLHNRAMARAEAAHTVPDEAWPHARINADEAIQELITAIEALEKQLTKLPR
jgi:hypothetical protein